MANISTVMAWYRIGHFDNAAEARGAFKLAHQQWLDGLGDGSHAAWLGMTSEEFSEWMRHDTLPSRVKARLT